jgi:hypothetical protein
MHRAHAMRTTTHRTVLSNARAIRGPSSPAIKIQLYLRPVKMSELPSAYTGVRHSEQNSESLTPTQLLRCTARTQCAQQLTAPC